MKYSFLITSIFITIASFAQKISDHLNFQGISTIEISTNVNTTMNMMGNTIKSSLSSENTELYKVVKADKKEVTLTHSVSHISINGDGMGQTVAFDSNKPEDLQSEMGKPFASSLNARYTLTIDPKGTVIYVKKDSAQKADKEDDMMGAMLSQLNMNANPPSVGEGSIFKVLPEKTVSTGQKWIDSSAAESGKKKIVYTVSSITDKNIVIDFIMESDLKTTQEIMGASAKINSKSTGKGQIILDRASGLLRYKTTTIDSDQTIEAMGQSMPTTSKTTIEVNVKIS